MESHGIENPFHMTEFMNASKGGKYEDWDHRQGAAASPTIGPPNP